MAMNSTAATFIGDRTDFRDETIYFAMTTRFYDGDPNNNVYCWDGVKNINDPEWRGDFRGLINKLDYIKALGFTAVWITPIVENGSGLDYHGYHAMDFSKIDHRYVAKNLDDKGADVAFQELIDEVHKRGMKLILDIVLQPTGNFGEGTLCTLFEQDYTKDIVDINASVTTLTDERSVKLDHNRFGGSMNENACFPLLPILKLLGQDVRNINFYSIMKNDVDMYTKAVFRYDNATASFQVGLGAKTEGNMVISGTKGYIYVPAPWWKTDYFEQRFEDQNLNRKCFFPFMGEGLRYEIREFISHILNPDQSLYLLTKEEILKMTQIQEDYINGVNVYKLS